LAWYGDFAISSTEEGILMQLVIRRSQADAKGVFGGHKGVNFNLFYRIVLTPEETGVVQRYKLDMHVLSRSGNGMQETVADALRGVNQTVQSVDVLLNNEEIAKRACDSFYKLLLVAQSFGGEEVVQFPLDD
jgi:hypothetical protein